MKAEYTHEAVSLPVKWFTGHFSKNIFSTRPFDSYYIACRRQQHVTDVTSNPFFLSLLISTSEFLFVSGLVRQERKRLYRE